MLSSDSFESDPQCFILNYRWPLTLNQKLLVMIVQLSCQAFFRIRIFWYILYFTHNHILILWLVNMKTLSLIRVAQLVISTFGNVVNKTTPFILLAQSPYSKTLNNFFKYFLLLSSVSNRVSWPCLIVALHDSLYHSFWHKQKSHHFLNL